MTATAMTIWSDGQATVPARWLNRALQSVDNFAALRATPGIDGQTAWVEGGVTFNDGLQGTFSWSSANTAPDNNSSVIVPFGYVTGGWLLQPLAAGSLAPGSVTNAQLANAAAKTLKGNLTASTGPVADNTLTAVTAALGYATTILQGAVTLATNAQAIAGTSTTLAVTPAGLAAALAAFSPGGTITVTTNARGTAIQISTAVIQFGTITIAPAGANFATGAITFPVSFPTTCIACFSQSQNLYNGGTPSGTGQIDICVTYGLGITGATARIDTNAATAMTGTHTIMWAAFGY